MVEIPSFSVICELLEGKPGIWEQVKPIAKLALLVSPVLATDSFILMEILEEGLTLSDPFDLIESGTKAIWGVFEKKKPDPMDSLRKVRLANTLLVYSAYFDTLAKRNEPLWKKVEPTSAECHDLAKIALKGEKLMDNDGRGILPGIGDEKLMRFYTRLNDEFRRFAEGLEGIVALRADWNHYPAMAAKNYRDQYEALRLTSDAFKAWSCGKSDEFVHEILVQIWEGVRKQNRLEEKSAPSALRLPLGTSMGNRRFHGRQKLVEQLWQEMASGRPIVLSGLGGIGKTALAKYFGQEYSKQKGCQVYFVVFDGSFENTVIRSVARGIPDLPENLSEAQIYNRVMKRLAQCSAEDLLIIDNADREEGCFDDLRDSAYYDLCSLPMQLMVTTRFWDPDFIEIPRLDNASLYKIFETYKAQLSQSQMDLLINAVDGHTMTIDLMARTYRRSGETVTAEMILEAMQKSTLAEENYPDVRTDHDRQQRQIYAHLQALFDLSELSVDSRRLLRYATLLPPDGLAPDLFRCAVGQGPAGAAADLVDRGWLCLENHVYTIHPVIRLVCREELKPTDENCRVFLKLLSDQYDRKQYNKAKYRQLAELFSRASEILEDRRGNWAQIAGGFWETLGDYEKMRKYMEKVLEIREKLPISEHVDLATSYNNVGVAYRALGDYEKALKYLCKALTIWEKALEPDETDLAASYNNVGQTYGDLGIHQKALEYKEKALKIRKKVLPANHLDLAQSYNNAGQTYSDLGDHQKALEYKKKALAIREKALPADHPLVSASYDNVGSSYGDLGNYRKELEYLLKALVIREKVLPLDHPDLARVYNNVGVTYRHLGDHRKTLEYLLKALKIWEKVLPLDHPDLARAYNNVGSTYDGMGNRTSALEYKEKALEIWKKKLPPNHPDLARAYNNVGVTYGGMGNHRKALDYLLKALKIRENTLPPLHPDIARSCNNIAVILAMLGRLSEARIYSRRSVNIAQKVLPAGHPYLISYWQTLESLER